MAKQKVFSAQFSIGGKLEPSVAKAMAFMQSGISNINKATKLIGTSAANTNRQFKDWELSVNKVNRQTSALRDSLRRVGEIAAGVSIGTALESGLRSAIGLVENLSGKFVEFTKTASELASKRELMTNSIGNLMHGNMPLAKAVMEQEFRTAVLSPFQGKDLQAGVRELLGSGVSLDRAQWLASRGGDITAALGGGQDELSRLYNAMTQTEASGFFSGEQAKELRHLGVPYQKILEQMLNVDAATLDKMQRKHMITASVFERMIEKLTGKDGIFFHGMIHFAETFQGLETSVMDLAQKFQADFGDIANAWAKLVFKGIGGSDGWNKIFTWVENMGKANQAVISFVSSLPTSEVFGKMSPALKGLMDQVHYIFGPKGLGYFFDYNVGGTMGSFYEKNGYHLNVAGQEKIKEFLDKIQEIVDRVLLIGDRVGAALKWIGDVSNFMDKIYGLMNKAADYVQDHGNATGAQKSNQIDPHAPNSPFMRSLNIPGHASGGIVTGPELAMLAERGPEAVIPLSNPEIFDDLNDSIRGLNDFLSNVAPNGYPNGPLSRAGAGGAFTGGAIGGVKLTDYGPLVDPIGSRYFDRNSYNGIGDRSNTLTDDLSVALTQSMREELFGVRGKSTGKLFKWGGKTYRDDDTAPESDKRIDRFHSGDVHIHLNLSAVDHNDVAEFFQRHGRTIARTIKSHLDDELGRSALA